MIIPKLPNWIENPLIAILTLLAINFLIIQPMANRYERRLDKQSAVIVELAKIEKYKIQNDFEKLKSTKGSDIVIDLDNKLEALELDLNTDSIPSVKKKKGFFRKIFGGKK